MKIQTITLENFRGIREAGFLLDGKSTVFFGVNGVGKSAILRAINLVFSNIINKIVNNRFKQGIKIEEDDITFGKSQARVKLDFVYNDGTIAEYGRSMNRKSKSRTHLPLALEDIYSDFCKRYLDDEKSNMPIYVNYGTTRLVLDIPLRIRNTHIFDKQAAFEKAIESKIDYRTFFEWYRYQEDIENEIKSRTNSEYADKSLCAVKKAITEMINDVSNLRIERSPRLAMKVNKGPISLKVNQLSDGEKCILALLGDLTRRLALANPHLDNPLLGEGVVLIDEIELHMHPQWQRRILNTLSNVFPNIQFIITTHSPQILGEVGSDYNIFGLYNENGVVGAQRYKALDGWDSNDILEVLMDTGNLNLDTKGEISRMFELIDKKNYDEAEMFVARLEKKTNKNNPDIINAKMLIQKGRRGL